MYHRIKDMDLTKIPDNLEMAERIAINTIHEAYDSNDDECVVSSEVLERVYKAVKILYMVKEHRLK